MPLKFDISNSNFDNYFSIQSAGLGENQKELLPKELVFKLFRKGGQPNAKSTSKLSFLAKIFILIKAMKKRVIILVEDDLNGMDEEQYFKYKKLLKKNNLSIENSKELNIDGIFVLANKEIIDTYSSMNLLSTSHSYNYLTKAKNSVANKTKESIIQQDYLANLLSFYERNRKKLVTTTGLTMAEWLVLIRVFNGKEIESSPIYKEWYRFSYNSSSTKIKEAFSTLQSKGLVEKIGVSKGAKLRITTLGRLKTWESLVKYALNC